MTDTANKTLEDKLQAHGNDPVDMLRHAQVGGYDFPFPAQYTNWRDEQEAWQKSVVLFDQSFHMTDVYFEGPDVKKLLSDVGVNTMKNFGANKAKQIVACNPDGYVIGDAILFGHTDTKVSVVGRPSVPNWVHYNAVTGDYDVKVTRDERTVSNDGSRLIYRYQIQGPNALALIQDVHEGDEFPTIKFFNLGDLIIAGKKVRALNHNMSRMGGLELHGPVEDREWLSAEGFEANASLGGSFYSENIEDYYQTPWDLGYGKHIKFDHDFIGREALEAMADKPHRRKVWLKWNDEDVLKVFQSQLGEGDRFKYMEVPNAYYSTLPFDKVLVDGKMVGLSTYTVYTSNVRSWFSLAMIDEDVADGTEVTVIWGEEDGGSKKPIVERHVQTEIRATLSYGRLNDDE